MSGSRARARRRDPKAVRAEVLQVALQPCVCLADETSLAWARQITHDGIVSRTGTLRRSGVRWSCWTGAEALARWDGFVATSTAPSSPERRQNQETYRAYLVEHGANAALVIAQVDAAVPRAFYGPS